MSRARPIAWNATGRPTCCGRQPSRRWAPPVQRESRVIPYLLCAHDRGGSAGMSSCVTQLCTDPSCRDLLSVRDAQKPVRDAWRQGPTGPCEPRLQDGGRP